MTQVLYVYGTLRPGKPENEVLVPGKMYDLGWFPGVKLGEGGFSFVAERVEVNDDVVPQIDSYEGYNPDCEEHSFYVRKPFKEGWIYEFNGEVSDETLVSGGDWLKYTEKPVGSASRFLEGV
jgi:gamma-glutamylcyclotransferase (GGCT)/AIG2-like uncharacterized protein YtfP